MGSTGKNMQTFQTIDLRSDTMTKPTNAMREAMANALVGDDVWGEDPTINELESRVAKIFGKEASLFTISGTMANLLAVMVHCSKRGSEAIAGDLSHIFLYEQGNTAHIAGVQLSPIETKPDGTFCLTELKKKIRGGDKHEPITTLVSVENTHNNCGGKVLSLDYLDEFTKLCRENSLRAHMDGARVFNAAEYLNVPVSRITRDFDSVCFCLSKGLSAPVGSMLVGSKTFVNEARRLRKGLGGGMRQAGILAAAGLVALDTIVPILKEDHRRTKQLVEAICKLKCHAIELNNDNIQTNIVNIRMVDERVVSSIDFLERLLKVTQEELSNNITDINGQGIIVKTGKRDDIVRLVLHHDVNDEHLDLAIKKICYCLRELDEKFINELANGINKKK